MSSKTQDTTLRHVLGLSGGKDSAALAIYMRDRVPNMEYFFTDTGKELSETYEYLEKLEAYLGKEIVRLNPERDFDHWLEIYGGYLPASNMRWCTRMLKIKPFETYIGEDNVISYIGIRADENRDGYISTKPNIKPVFPFKENGITKADVFRILEESGVGIPSYYEWRTRSGCFFCFFQRKSEWVGLLERHPELYEEAKKYEKIDIENGIKYTWSEGESLEDLARPERVAQIKAKALEQQAKGSNKLGKALVNILDDDDTENGSCIVCHL